MDEHGAVLDVLIQEHWDTEAARLFFGPLLTESDIPEIIHTDKLGSYRAALRKIPVFDRVEHREVISTARCNNLLEQSHRPTRQQERQRAGPTGCRLAQDSKTGSGHESEHKAFSTYTLE